MPEAKLKKDLVHVDEQDPKNNQHFVPSSLPFDLSNLLRPRFWSYHPFTNIVIILIILIFPALFSFVTRVSFFSLSFLSIVSVLISLPSPRCVPFFSLSDFGFANCVILVPSSSLFFAHLLRASSSSTLSFFFVMFFYR